MEGNDDPYMDEDMIQMTGSEGNTFPKTYKMKYKDFILYVDEQIGKLLLDTPQSKLRQCLVELLEINLQQINQFSLLQRLAERDISKMLHLDRVPTLGMVETIHPVGDVDCKYPLTVSEHTFFSYYFEICKAGTIQHARMIELESEIIEHLNGASQLNISPSIKALFTHYIDILSLDMEMNKLEKSFIDYHAKEAYIAYSLDKSALTMNALIASGQEKIQQIQNSVSRMSMKEETCQPLMEYSGYNKLRDFLPPEEKTDNEKVLSFDTMRANKESRYFKLQ